MESEFGTMEQVCDIFANIMNKWSRNYRITNQLSKIIFEMLDGGFLASTVFYNNTKLKTGIIRAFVNDTLTYRNISFNERLKNELHDEEEQQTPGPIYTIGDEILEEMEIFRIAEQGIERPLVWCPYTRQEKEWERNRHLLLW